MDPDCVRRTTLNTRLSARWRRYVEGPKIQGHCRTVCEQKKSKDDCIMEVRLYVHTYIFPSEVVIVKQEKHPKGHRRKEFRSYASVVCALPTFLESHNLFGYVHLRWITDPYHGQRHHSLVFLNVRAVELEPVLTPLPLKENRLPQVNLTFVSSHQDGGKCSRRSRKPFLVQRCTNPSWI